MNEVLEALARAFNVIADVETKMNENHDERGRFASGGAGGAGGGGGPLAQEAGRALLHSAEAEKIGRGGKESRAAISASRNAALKGTLATHGRASNAHVRAADVARTRGDMKLAEAHDNAAAAHSDAMSLLYR